MKIELTKTDLFFPITVTFTIHSQPELDALGCMFKCTPITDTLRELSGVSKFVYFYEPFRAAGANIRGASEFCKKVVAHPAMTKFLPSA